MKRTVTEDKGYVPDYEFSMREFKKRIGIIERGNVRTVDINGRDIVIEMPRNGDQKVCYQTDQDEFKRMLGITSPYSVLIVFASVWSSKVRISMSGKDR